MAPPPFKPPGFQVKEFHCPYSNCAAYSHQYWAQVAGVFERSQGHQVVESWSMSKCKHCNCTALWVNEKLIFPASLESPPPNADLPPDIMEDYNEAREIAGKSPRGAAALLRLCVQKLCQHLGKPGKNINDDIAALVKDGLPEKIQQSLDIVRVVGNNAVHPGQMDLKENRETVSILFGLVNIIAEDRISEPARVNELWNKLPEAARIQVEKRDG